MNNSQEIIRYIISFLLYGHEDATKLLGYTLDTEQAKQFKLTIRPSMQSPLNDPQKSWADFLPEVEQIMQNRTISAEHDIVSFACFFLSRAEEMLTDERDQHGRFAAKQSIIARHNLLTIPLIDEYSRWLMKRLGLSLPQPQFSAINLTHDVDVLEQYRHLRGALGGLKRGELSRVYQSLKDISADPAWTFKWIRQQDQTITNDVDNAHSIYFIKASSGVGYDYPQYNLKGSDFRKFIDEVKDDKTLFGLHTSYLAGQNGKIIKEERERLEKAIRQSVELNRYHYLRSTTIDNMQQLADAGITHDYSIGFADQVGFRLLTSRPVKWINPKLLRLTNLTLHPLQIMDRTLSDYMALTQDEAYYTAQQIIDKTRQNAGELTLLWHNTSVSEDYHKTLYTHILALLK